MAFYIGDKPLDTDTKFIRKTEIPVQNMWAMGRNSDGQLGLGNLVDQTVSFVRVGGSNTWKQIAIDTNTSGANTNSSFGIRGDGTLWAWGVDVADGTTRRSSPVRYGSAADWKSIVVRSRRVFVIKTDGSLWAYGLGSEGALGLGNVNNSTLGGVTQVGQDTNWNTVSTYVGSTLATKTDGSLWAWGDNGNYQLGLGDAINRSSPVRVGALNDWKNVCTGGQCTFAIKTDGSLWAWGNNQNGQLGLGNKTSYSSPVRVGALNDWKIISAQNDEALKGNVLAIKTDGSLWAWGQNDRGQLGLGNTASYSSPVRIGALSNWKSVVIAGGAVFSIKTDGTLWAWGENNRQLGFNDTAHRSSPTLVGTVGSAWISVDISSEFSIGITAF